MSDPAKQDANRKQQIAVEGSFPASDAASPPAVSGARAVPPEELMPGDEPALLRRSTTLDRRFPDAGAADLAIEALVREAPIERSQARAEPDGSWVRLTVEVAPGDAGRVEAILARNGALAD